MNKIRLTALPCGNIISKSLEYAVSKKWSLEIRLSALLYTMWLNPPLENGGEKGDWTFYGHDVVGAKMTAKALTRLKFSKKQTDLIAKLVRYHFVFLRHGSCNVIGCEATCPQCQSGKCLGSYERPLLRSYRYGTPERKSPYRLRKYEAMIEEAMRAPLSVTALKIDGNRLMQLIKIQPGPKIGQILNILFEEVLDEPEKNTQEYLEKRAVELNSLPEKELEKSRQASQKQKESTEEAEINEIRKSGLLSNSPFYRRLTGFDEILVGFGKMLATEKSRNWRKKGEG